MRTAKYAGLFYEKGEISLKKQIQECFEGERGPGATPPVAQKQKTAPLPKALIAPHAGYQYSGACAAWAYKTIGDAPIADVYIILAPSHKGGNGLTQEPFATPLGTVRVDQDFSRRLLEKGTIKENDAVHQDEHSIEVQLPFLQFAHQERLEQIKIVPILVDHELDLQKLSVDLKEIIMDTGKKVVFIVSTDFTHYGRNYRYIPFSMDIQENIAKLDEGAIEYIKTFDHKGLKKYADDTMITMCGLYPVMLLLRTIKSEKVLVEQYYTSTVVTGDAKNSVSYASIAFF